MLISDYRVWIEAAKGEGTDVHKIAEMVPKIPSCHYTLLM